MSLPTFHVSISGGAEDDLEEIRDYIARTQSVANALFLLDEIAGRLDTLERLPRRGSRVYEMREIFEDEVRQVHCGRYRIIYSLFGDQVTIIIVADRRQNIGAMLQRRLLRRSP